MYLIGARLKKERIRLRKTQEEFAALAGITRKTLFTYEAGHGVPDAISLVKWAAAGLDATFVLTGAELEPTSLAMVTEVLRITAQQEPNGGALTDKAIAAIHDIGGLAVAEPRADYASMTSREKALLENYRASDEAGKKALETTSAALAQSAGEHSKHG